MGNTFMLVLAGIQVFAATSFIVRGSIYFGILTILYALSNVVLWWMEFKGVS